MNQFTSMCLGLSMNFSINIDPSPNAALASDDARSNDSTTSSMLRTTLIPRPPPP